MRVPGGKAHDRAEAVFGPFSGVQRWRDAVRRLGDAFGLRDCPDRMPIRFADQRPLFVMEQDPGCLRHGLGTCLGPCASRCTQRDYAAAVRRAAEFLRGSDLSLLTGLEESMRAAAATHQYERAAALRDSLDALQRLSRHLRSLEESRTQYTFVYRLRAQSGGETWYFLRRGVVVASARGPHDEASAARCQQLLEKHYFPTPGEELPEPREDMDVLLLVNAWFHRRGEELSQTLSPEQAREAAQDKWNRLSCGCCSK